MVVQFVQRQKEDSLLRNARDAGLMCFDLGMDSLSAVFVIEHLCL